MKITLGKLNSHGVPKNGTQTGRGGRRIAQVNAPWPCVLGLPCLPTLDDTLYGLQDQKRRLNWVENEGQERGKEDFAMQSAGAAPGSGRWPARWSGPRCGS